MDAELSAVRDFLSSHAPYGALEPSEMSSLLATMGEVYVRRGTEVIGLGASNDTAYVVRSGAVEIRDTADDLVERAEESMTSWSYALSLMRIFCPATVHPSRPAPAWSRKVSEDSR